MSNKKWKKRDIYKKQDNDDNVEIGDDWYIRKYVWIMNV